jgi:hypothetical protein
MSISLYDATVASYDQILGAVSGFLDRGLSHSQENNADPAELVAARLFDNMLPLSFQIVSVNHHSIGAIEGCKAGKFGPPNQAMPADYAAMQKLVADTREALKSVTPADVEALEGKDVTFAIGEFKIPFTAEKFLLSFSLPNFYFHAATAYDILRSRGVPLGKRDFMGALRMKT